MTLQLQEEELNILDSLNLIESTVGNLKEIRSDDDAMDAELDAISQYGKTIGIESKLEFNRKHRIRFQPRRFDKNPETTATYNFHSIYRKAMYEVLDSLTLEYDENLKVCLQKVKSLADALQPTLTEISTETAQNLCKLFLPCT